MKTSTILRAIADNLETNVPDIAFNMNYWLHSNFRYDCQTVACAIGSSLNVPEVQETGLIIDIDKVPYYPPTGDYSFGAIREAFKLKDRAEAQYLFDPAKYPEHDPDLDINTIPKKTVINRLRDYASRIEHEENR